MYNKVELFHEELQSCNEGVKKEINEYSEMTMFQRDFLCGMIKMKKPKKIVEIGVSAGATTAVVLNCLNTLDISCEMYSVDINKTWYQTWDRETGFIVKDYIKIRDNIKHKFMLGYPAGCVMEEIGGGIDFLILDTTHSLPGEVFDFLVCMPFLVDGAVVVLHDIVLDLVTKHLNEIASKALFSTVCAKKWYMEEQDMGLCGLSNIAAFEVSQETRVHITDTFLALSWTWSYLIPEDELSAYNRIVEKYYGKDILEWVKKVELVQELVYTGEIKWMQIRKHCQLDGQYLKSIWSQQKNVILYGAGFWGKLYLSYAKAHNLPVTCFVISDEEKEEFDEIEGVPIYKLSELPFSPEEGVICRTLSRRRWGEIGQKLKELGWHMLI